jgi:hypothetical protein
MDRLVLRDDGKIFTSSEVLQAMNPINSPLPNISGTP